jgi:hypothetical protein
LKTKEIEKVKCPVCGTIMPKKKFEEEQRIIYRSKRLLVRWCKPDEKPRKDAGSAFLRIGNNSVLHSRRVRLIVGDNPSEDNKAAKLLRKAGYSVRMVLISGVSPRIDDTPLASYARLDGIKKFIKDHPCPS